MDERKIRILDAIIKDYIKTGEPVGSRTIAKKYDLGVSSATIRNEMSDLEELGYLMHLHSSSGRIPSDLAYRLYVDELMHVEKLSKEEELLIKSELLSYALYQVDKIIDEATSLLSRITKLATVVKMPSLEKSFIKYIQLLEIDNNNILAVIVIDNGIIKNNLIRVNNAIDKNYLQKLSNLLNTRLGGLSIDDIDLEVINKIKQDLRGHDEIFNALIPALYESLKNIETSSVQARGEINILNYPEYSDVEKAKEFVKFIHNKENIEHLLNERDNETDLSISIGQEIKLEQAKDCSFISTIYSIKDKPLGVIGVIGPKRINYDRIVPILNNFVKELNNKLADIYFDDK